MQLVEQRGRVGHLLGLVLEHAHASFVAEHLDEPVVHVLRAPCPTRRRRSARPRAPGSTTGTSTAGSSTGRTCRCPRAAGSSAPSAARSRSRRRRAGPSRSRRRRARLANSTSRPLKNSMRMLPRCDSASFEHLLALFEVEQRLRLLRVADDRDDDLVEVTGRALDDVDVAEGHRIERSRTEGGRHAGLPVIGSRRTISVSPNARSQPVRQPGGRTTRVSGRALDHDAARPSASQPGRAERGEERGHRLVVGRRTAGRRTRGRTARSSGGMPAEEPADVVGHDARPVVESECGDVRADRLERALGRARRARARAAPRDSASIAERAACRRRGRARSRRRAGRARRARRTPPRARCPSSAARASPSGATSRRPRCAPAITRRPRGGSWRFTT